MNNAIVSSMKTETIQFRVSAETKKALEVLAKQKKVSITRLLEYALLEQFPELAEHLPGL